MTPHAVYAARHQRIRLAPPRPLPEPVLVPLPERPEPALAEAAAGVVVANYALLNAIAAPTVRRTA